MLLFQPEHIIRAHGPSPTELVAGDEERQTIDIDRYETQQVLRAIHLRGTSQDREPRLIGSVRPRLQSADGWIHEDASFDLAQRR
jgi:hypothetical protein